MSEIEWTDETWNLVTGCTRVSPGCRHCYMYRQYPRLKAMGVPGYERAPDVVQLHPGRLGRTLNWKRPRRIFVNSMSDTFHPLVPNHFIRWMFQQMRMGIALRGHTYQILTKRPERAAMWWKHFQEDLMNQDGEPEWPEQVWLGVSAESQRWAERRLGFLARVPAPVRFVSAEPLLGPLDLRRWLGGVVQWVIVGGESGPRARPMQEQWALELLEQCDAAGVPAFLKQLGGRRGKRGGDQAVIGGRSWRGMPPGAAVGRFH